MKNKFDQFWYEQISKDPRNWRGPFYFNRKDPRIFVPKFMGWGKTLNFANTLTYTLIVGFIVIMIAWSYFYK